VVPRVEEVREGRPDRVVLENARRKARAGLGRWAADRPAAGSGESSDTNAGAGALARGVASAGTWVLGVDTDVAIDGRLLGKARDEAGARERLAALSGRAHEVLGGVCVIEATGEGGILQERTGVDRTVVRFHELDEREIARYVASGEWRDRAGGYAVQGLGSSLVAGLQGELANVIGLPIALFLQLAPNFASRQEAGENPKAKNYP
jgi:septum formation protein